MSTWPPRGDGASAEFRPGWPETACGIRPGGAKVPAMRVLLTACAAAGATLALVAAGPLAATAAGSGPQGPVGGAKLSTEPTVVADGATPPAVQASAYV